VSYYDLIDQQHESPTVGALVGAWRLHHLQGFYSDGEVVEKADPQVTGYLTYAEDGVASIVLGALDRLYLDAGDYRLDERSATVSHQFDIALFPDWHCAPFMARAQISHGTLSLRPTPVIAPDGRTLLLQFFWNRVDAAEAA